MSEITRVAEAEVNVYSRVLAMLRFTIRLAAFGLFCLSTAPAADSPVIASLGDSITKGVRAGVKPDETFSALLQGLLKEAGAESVVVNLGVGGETAGQGLARLDREVFSKKPGVVLIMYGTNDCWVDIGKKESRVSTSAYRRALESIVEATLKRGIIPILMTEPRYARKSGANGVGEHANVRLSEYMKICREVARAKGVRLVDHFDRWTKADEAGTDLNDWTTDGYHPNPLGHREMAKTILPVALEALRDGRSKRVDR